MSDPGKTSVHVAGTTMDITWPTLSEAKLSSLIQEERDLIQSSQAELVNGTTAQLNEINLGCTSKPQYAKTYRTLRRDKRQMLDAWRAKSAAAGSPPMMQLMIEMHDHIFDKKLMLMKLHFQCIWREDIDVWAGEEGGTLDKSGCLIVVISLTGLLAAAFSRWA